MEIKTLISKIIGLIQQGNYLIQKAEESGSEFVNSFAFIEWRTKVLDLLSKNFDCENNVLCQSFYSDVVEEADALKQQHRAPYVSHVILGIEILKEIKSQVEEGTLQISTSQ